MRPCSVASAADAEAQRKEGTGGDRAGDQLSWHFCLHRCTLLGWCFLCMPFLFSEAMAQARVLVPRGVASQPALGVWQMGVAQALAFAERCADLQMDRRAGLWGGAGDSNLERVVWITALSCVQENEQTFRILLPLFVSERCSAGLGAAERPFRPLHLSAEKEPQLAGVCVAASPAVQAGWGQACVKLSAPPLIPAHAHPCTRPSLHTSPCTLLP